MQTRRHALKLEEFNMQSSKKKISNCSAAVHPVWHWVSMQSSE